MKEKIVSFAKWTLTATVIATGIMSTLIGVCLIGFMIRDMLL